MGALFLVLFLFFCGYCFWCQASTEEDKDGRKKQSGREAGSRHRRQEEPLALA